MPVRKKFFLSISEKKVRVALEKEYRSQNAIPSPDKRGHHAPANMTSEEMIKHMVDHIDSSARVPAHWCRAGTLRTREFLECHLTKVKMYNLYLDHCKATKIKPLSKTIYLSLIHISEPTRPY